MKSRTAPDWIYLVPFFGILLMLIVLAYVTLEGIISPDGFVVGAGTFLLAMATFYLAFTEIAESRENRRQDRELAARVRAISNYPLLSQKIETKGVQSNVLTTRGDTQHGGTHFMLLIQNYGKGPAINQTEIYYIFFKIGENQIHQNRVTIKGAHDIIAPDDERILDMTILSENDWKVGMEKKYDTIWVRLPHKDIQRNDCCNCTTYEYFQIKGRWGKIERHWYFASYPEISSEKCKECEWLTMEAATE